MKIPAIIAKTTAEFIGTFALVFMGCGAVMLSHRLEGSIPPGAVPVVFGLTVAIMIYAFGHISGAHLNPAVTAAFASIKRFPFRQILPYWIAQILGGISAISLLTFILPEGATFGATVPQIDLGKALVLEVLLSFFLMIVITSVATDSRAEGIMAGIAIGATVAVCAFVGGPLTGASMNPARTLAPNLFEGQMAITWLYWVGPIIGTVLAATVYQVIRCAEEPSGGPGDAGGCC